MHSRLYLLILLLTAGLALNAQPRPDRPTTTSPSSSPQSSPQLPSPEEFLNDVFHTVVDSNFHHYYLITGADTCRFIKYDYDEWIKYYLLEPVPFTTLNELSEKAFLSRYPYYWKQNRLEKAVCITVKKADSLLFPARYTPVDSVHHRRHKDKTRSKTSVEEQLIYSFSLPQFTDDGRFAVIDLNTICGASCGLSLTCLFKHGSTGWHLIGRHVNWSSSPASSTNLHTAPGSIYSYSSPYHLYTRSSPALHRE